MKLSFFFGCGFGLPHDSQDITAHDLVDLGCRVTSIEQFLGNDGIGRDIVQLFGEQADTIIIGSDSDVVDPRDFDDVVDMIDDIVDAPSLDGIFSIPAFSGGFKIRFEREFGF